MKNLIRSKLTRLRPREAATMTLLTPGRGNLVFLWAKRLTRTVRGDESSPFFFTLPLGGGSSKSEFSDIAPKYQEQCRREQ